MTSRNWKPRFLGTLGGIVAAVCLATNLAFAISAIDGPDGPSRRRQALRLSELAAMDQFARDYGTADWSAVGAALHEQPQAPGNTRIFSIFLSLGNVYLNRFEVTHSQAALDAALGYFEMVAANEELWGRRPLAGSVVVYLGVSLVRLNSECDVGASGDRIEALRVRFAEIAAAEADAVAPIEEYASLAQTTAEEDAARAALYATAAAFLHDDSRAAEWGRDAVALAATIFSSGSPSPETALTMSQAELIYQATGDVPRFFGAFVPSSAVVVAFRGSATGGVEAARTAAIDPSALDSIVRDSQTTAARLALYLAHYPAGSQCEMSE